MTEPSVEEIVARVERGLRHLDPHTFPEYPAPGDVRALIASWRERGEEIRRLRDLAAERSLVQSIRIEGLTAALKDKP